MMPQQTTTPRSQNVFSDAGAAPTLDTFDVELVAAIPFLQVIARGLCGHRESADDLVQDTLACALLKRDLFLPGTNLKAWLWTMQRNAFLSSRRRSWRQVAWGDDIIGRMVTKGSQFNSVELTELARAMSLLSDDQHEALLLIGAGGFSYIDVALMYDCAPGTIKSRVSRARTALLLSLKDGGANLPKARGDAGHGYQQISRELSALIARKAPPATPAASVMLH